MSVPYLQHLIRKDSINFILSKLFEYVLAEKITVDEASSFVRNDLAKHPVIEINTGYLERLQRVVDGGEMIFIQKFADDHSRGKNDPERELYEKAHPFWKEYYSLIDDAYDGIFVPGQHA